MHPGIIDVDPTTPMSYVAELMATQRVHAVAVGTPYGPEGETIVSALDLVAAAGADADQRVGEIAATERLTISSDERVDRAAQLMAEHELSHLIVTEAASGRPVGILSTLDVLSAVGR